MAEIATMPEKVAEKLFDRIWNEIQYLFTYKENKENLEKDLNMLHGKTARVKESVQEAEGNVKSIYADVEKWIERVEVVKKEANEVLQGKVQMICLYIKFPNIKSRYSLSRKAKRLSGEIKDLIQEVRDFGTEVGYRPPKGQNKYLLPHDFEKFASRSLTMKKVLKKLKDPEIRIIGIWGMAGVGKTKLAMEIADRVKVENLFDDVTFATVSRTEDFSTIDIKRIQVELAAGLRLDISDVKDSPFEIAKRLSERLSLNSGDSSSKDKRQKKRNILVILDDVWDNQNLDLPSLGIPIKNGHEEGLKVMITSRFKHVCLRLGATNEGTIEVEVMQEEEACLLFKEIAGISDDDDNDDLKKIAEEVAKECGGLPLAIVCIGGLLKHKKALNIWKDVLRQLRNSNVAIIKGEKNLVFSRIELSYENLHDEEYRSLLLLCSLFPEDYQIHIETLVRYVKGLEVFDDASKILTMLETRSKVDTIVDHLKDCCLLSEGIQSGTHVKLHDVVRDVCLSILAAKEKEREVGQGGSNNIRFMSRQVFCCENEREIQISMEGMKKDVVKVLDLTSFYKTHWQLSSLLQCCSRSLRQLCLENIEVLQDISCIRQLETLEILSFYKSKLVRFPEEVAELKNLKLLDLRFSSVQRFLSGVFLQLKKLEELYMGYYIPGVESIEEAKMAWITEAHSLSNLTTFQIKGIPEHILPMLRYLDTRKMERFEIVGNHQKPFLYWPDYEVQRYIELDKTILKATSLDSEENRNFAILMKKSNTLWLAKIEGLRNVVPELDEDGLTDLKSFELRECSDVEYIVDASDVDTSTRKRKRLLLNQRDPLRNMEELTIDGCENLKTLCRGGRIQPTRWLCNLKSVIISNTKAMTSLFLNSNLKLFEHLEELSTLGCPALENVIDMEIEDIEEQEVIIKLPRLKDLRLNGFIELKGFYLAKNSKNTSQALFNQVSLPTLVTLILKDGKLPRNILGHHMSKGSLDNLQTIVVERSEGVACIAKADSLRLLENLENVRLVEVPDLEVVFDFEGLKVMSTQKLQLLGKLSDLTLIDMPRLMSIWRMIPPTGVQAFWNLKFLSLYSCFNIRGLLPINVIHMLVNLEEIWITECPSMENVIINCFEGGGSSNRVVLTQEHIITTTTPKDHTSKKEFEFPKLGKIVLVDLDKLRSFCPAQDFTLIFPSLTLIELMGCPKLTRFSCGKLSAPNLKSLEGVVPSDLEEFVARKKGDTTMQ